MILLSGRVSSDEAVKISTSWLGRSRCKKWYSKVACKTVKVMIALVLLLLPALEAVGEEEVMRMAEGTQVAVKLDQLRRS